MTKANITVADLLNGDIVRDGQLTKGQPREVLAVSTPNGAYASLATVYWTDGYQSTIPTTHTPQIVERGTLWIDRDSVVI